MQRVIVLSAEHWESSVHYAAALPLAIVAECHALCRFKQYQRSLGGLLLSDGWVGYFAVSL